MKIFICIALMLMTVTVFCQTVTKGDNGDIRVQGANYAAVFSGESGSMTTLWIKDNNLMEQERYYGWIQDYQTGFFTANPALLEEQYGGTAEIKGSSVVCTMEGLGTAVYDMKDTGFTVKAANISEKPVSYIMAFSGKLTCIESNGKAVEAKSNNFPEGISKWVLGNILMTAESEGVWEGYSYSSHIARFALEPGETKQMTVRLGNPFPRQMEKAYSLRMNYKDEPVDIASPVDWQVFQRKDKFSGAVLFDGRVNIPCDKLYYSINGTGLNGKKLSGSPRELSVKNGLFSVSVPVPAGGWYKVEITAEKNGKTVFSRTIDRVGVGEVFVGAGQSNSTNWGQYHIEQESGMVSATDGVKWMKAEGALPGVHDGSTGGNYYPAFGDNLYKEFGVPIGIASAGHGGSAIFHWRPDWMLYKHFMNRVRDLGQDGFRGVLWHQGEADCLCDFDATLTNMINLIEESRRDAGWYVPWFVAKVSYQNPTLTEGTVRNVHQALWDLGIAFEGPDTDRLTGKMRDYDGQGVHLSPEGLKEHGRMWAEKVIPYIHACID